MTKRELQRLVRFWAPALGIGDWTIRVTRCKPIKDAEAQCIATWETRVADIEIGEDAPDPEQALVHELLHCIFEPFFVPNNKPKRALQERAIDSIATALVRVKRG